MTVSRPLPRAAKEALKALGWICLLASIPMALFVISILGEGREQRTERASLDLQLIERALLLYVERTGGLPSSTEGWAALQRVGIFESNPIDPWGNPYGYSVSGRLIEIESLGADGRPGGEGRDADLKRQFVVPGPDREDP